MAKPHFKRTETCKIHTMRGCGYKTAAPSIAPHKPEAAHHIIPVATFEDYTLEEKYEKVIEEITEVYKATDYCANRKKNIINLPKKPTYSSQQKTAAGWPAVWTLNLPAHDWDHPQYNEEVREQLRLEIWDKFLPKEPPVDCPDEAAVATSFDTIETNMHTQLTVTCPSRSGSTLLAIKSGEVGGPQWWYSFSMAMKVRDEPVFVFAAKSAVPVPLLR
jgi:hypothetical protein